MSDDRVERGAAEEASGTPLTPTEVDASRTPPSEGPGQPDEKPTPVTGDTDSNRSD